MFLSSSDRRTLSSGSSERSRVVYRFLTNFEWQATLLMLLLCCAGLCVLSSAGFDASTGYSAPMQRQAMSMAIGLGVFSFCSIINTSFWKFWAYPFFVVGCVLLIAVLVNGHIAGGAQRWLNLGGLRMQPSEFMKFGLILTLARLFSERSAPLDGYSLVTLLIPGAVIGVPAALILIEPDLGTALCLSLVGGTMLLIMGVRWRAIKVLLMVAPIVLVIGWFSIRDYQRQRVLTFMSPENDPLGSGYHAMQSKIAVGSGMMTGKGFLHGTQTQLRFLPEQTTDFIFSVLAEEWGFIGSAAVLIIYGLLVVRLLQIGMSCKDSFPSFVTFGVGALLFWHAIINVGMVIGVMPVVGITLPLLSFGGSSVVTLMSALGIVVGISTRRFMFTNK